MAERTPTVVAYVAAGSSIEPERNLLAAMEMLQERVRITAVSTVLRTPAIGRPNDPDFLNCIFEFRTSIEPRTLKFDVLRAIEDALGRQRGDDPYAPRTIDLDLLLCGDAVVDEDDVQIPDGDIERPFVRAGLAELGAAEKLPSCRPLLTGDKHEGEPVIELTEMLRRRLQR